MSVSGSCHCGAQRFTVAEAPTTVTRCTCSICAKRGALSAYYRPEAVTLQTRPDALTAYQWGDRMMTFHHCAICGCGVFNEGPDWDETGIHPTRRKITINARLLDDFDLGAVTIRDVDGKNDW